MTTKEKSLTSGGTVHRLETFHGWLKVTTHAAPCLATDTPDVVETVWVQIPSGSSAIGADTVAARTTGTRDSKDENTMADEIMIAATVNRATRHKTIRIVRSML